MKKYFLIILSILLLFGLIIFTYYYSIWSEEQEKRNLLIDRAYNEVSALETIDEIDFYTGDKDCYMIFGRNKADIPILVWTEKDELNYIYLFDWVPKETIKEKAIEISPDITVKRINAGIDENGEFIYEVLYEDIEQRLGYQYFYLQTGEFIKMYRLGKVR